MIGPISVVPSLAAIAWLFTAVPPQINADPATFKELVAARSLKCAFPWYVSTDWDADEPVLKPNKAKQGFEFQIDGIDFKKGLARIIGNAGADDLNAILGDSTVSFIEIVPSGSVNVTTVYAWRNNSRRFKAVHSRHVAIGGPAPSQNYGYCEPW